MLQRVTLRRSDVIVPVFVTEGVGVRKPVASMPGVSQMSVDVATDFLAARAEEGYLSYLVFGVIDRAKKDAVGSEALNPDNVVCRLFRSMPTGRFRWPASAICAFASTPTTATAARCRPTGRR